MLKSKRINIRLTEKDYRDIQLKAIEEWYTLSNTDFKYYPQIQSRWIESRL